MSGLLRYGPKPIVDNGLVFHIDPANPVSAGSTQRDDPINGVTDMNKEGRKYYSTSSVDSSGAGNTSYKPAWENNNGGTIKFTRGDGSVTNKTNRGFIWDVSDDLFALKNCNEEDGTTDGNVVINDYSDLKIKNLTQLNFFLIWEIY